MITEDEKEIIVQGILEASLAMVEKRVSSKPRKSRAKKWSSQQDHSKSTQVTKSVLFNTLSDKQRLPARVRDFRVNLRGDGNKVRQTELARALSRNVRLFLLENRQSKFSFSVGRQKAYYSEERRGRPSYYTQSKVKEMIDEVLEDPVVVERITDTLVSSNMLFQYLKIAFIDTFRKLKEYQNEYLETYRPLGLSRGQTDLNRDKIPKSSLIVLGKTTDKDIENLAGRYALKTMREFMDKKEINRVFFKIMGLLFFGSAYEPKLEK